MTYWGEHYSSLPLPCKKEIFQEEGKKKEKSNTTLRGKMQDAGNVVEVYRMIGHYPQACGIYQGEHPA